METQEETHRFCFVVACIHHLVMALYIVYGVAPQIDSFPAETICLCMIARYTPFLDNTKTMQKQQLVYHFDSFSTVHLPL